MKSLVIPVVLLMFFACNSSSPPPTEEKPEEPKMDYYKEGAEISGIAQTELLNNVKAAMEQGGPVNAIKYCNIHASPITDSLSKHFGCNIARVAIKNRSPENAPEDAEENILLNHFLERSLEGSDLTDTLIAKNGNLIYYRPIFIGLPTCLSCHGQAGTDIKPETMSKINELYPNDKATNYIMGEFRGAWRITFSL